MPKKNNISAGKDVEGRGNMYRFLSAAYLRPPTPDLVQSFLDEDFLEDLSSLFGKEAVADLRKSCARAASARLDQRLAALRQEYMDLFAVPTGRYVIPFEDVYRGKTMEGNQERGPLLGQRAIAARRMYREAGAQMDRACKELPTHIGVELSFMSFLCEREAAAIRREKGGRLRDRKKGKAGDCIGYRKLQIRFLREHLNEWFPQLSQSIQANTKSPLYRGLARITEEFLAQDTESLLAECNAEKYVSVSKRAR